MSLVNIEWQKFGGHWSKFQQIEDEMMEKGGVWSEGGPRSAPLWPASLFASKSLLVALPHSLQVCHCWDEFQTLRTTHRIEKTSMKQSARFCPLWSHPQRTHGAKAPVMTFSVTQCSHLHLEGPFELASSPSLWSSSWFIKLVVCSVTGQKDEKKRLKKYFNTLPSTFNLTISTFNLIIFM